MNEAEFLDVVLEELFIQGLDCMSTQLLLTYARQETYPHVTLPDPVSFAKRCRRFSVIVKEGTQLGLPTSPNAKAGATWVAVHEAGHAIVGMKAGFRLRGIRFYGDGTRTGQAALEELHPENSMDNDFLRRLVRVAVAGNAAEVLHPDCGAPTGGRLSEQYFDRTTIERPSDFCQADVAAIRLAMLTLGWNGLKPISEEVWGFRRACLRRGEEEANEVLRENWGALLALVEELKIGPVRGTRVAELLA